MTLRSFGQIMPLQGGMLFLAGYGSPEEDGVRDLVRQIDDEKIIENMKEGRRILQKVTAHDFGYSLHDWHNFLINDKKHSGHYMRASTWVGVERAVKAELRNPDRARLEALADQM
ncbi:hypothetical protein JMK10_19300 [Rhodovulum sulfidophilum]|uniref:hypothetical protein n=1 Tax=Rhodovulum sulfidophilum TaxID=35806 RepID=UPI001F46B307|nr:hypothetical protein [Rhodovulum sulfidophilum]MCF4118880.1 hypothetical protein [Rhodovulum sulfidophilum]